MSNTEDSKDLPDQFQTISPSISHAYNRIAEYIIPTRIVFDESTRLCLKCEHEQKTGSFKWRGALSKISSLQNSSGIVTASTGNHGLAVANAAKLFGYSAKIYVPENASKKKVQKIISTGAEVIKVNGDSLDAELAGKQDAIDNNLSWISPYNDVEVIAGQGTIGIEIERELPEINKVFITVGGGGLISGIASWLKSNQPHIEIIGCQPAHSREMYLSTIAGHVVDDPESSTTLSDGSAGPLENDSITFPICSSLIDRFVLISEEEIKHAIKHLYDHHQMIVEGAAGVAMAAAMKEDRTGGNDVVILCGGNIDPEVHNQICEIDHPLSNIQK